MKFGVLGLQGAVAAHIEALEGLGASACDVRSAEALEGVDALVIPGGESTTMSMLLERNGLIAPLRERLADGMPALGTCAGMILLGSRILDGRPDQHCLGAIDIDVRRNAFGRQIDSFETELTVDVLGEQPFRAVFIRAPIVDRVADDVEVLATVADRPVLCRQGTVVVAAFHPELGGDGRIHEYFVGLASRAGRCEPG